MAVIFCQAGQCGNQLGLSILDSLYRHLKPSDDADHMETFFRESVSSSRQSRLFARAVCIDTEPKVVNECLSRSKREKHTWSYHTPNMLYRHGGAGNNWAMGYQMCSGDFLDSSINCLRRELECCDLPPMLLTIHSTAGGTGSGLGTRITEAMCEEFSDVTRMNISITPYHFGEVVVQHYNSVLSLAKISAASNAVLTFENEVAQDLCKKMRRIERPTIEDINQTITASLVPILLPKYSTRRSDTSGRIASHLQDDVADLCSHPGFRFLDVKTTPQTSEKSIEFTYDSWTTLLSTLDKMHDRGTALDARLGASAGDAQGKEPAVNRSVGCVVTLRGVDAKENATAPHHLAIPVKSSPLTKQLQPVGRFFSRENFSVFVDEVHMHHSPHVVNGYQRSASMLSNGQTILPILQRAASKAAELFRVGAYVHQYASCGLEGEDFIQSFRTVGQLIENYRSL